MQKQITTLLLVMVIAGLMALVVMGSQKKERQLTQEKISTLQSSEPVFYYGNTCPHCKEVEEWFEQNDVQSKISFSKKEVYDNRANSAELTKVAGSCGIPSNQIGMPFLYAKGKCYVGSPDIIAYFTAELEASGEKLPEEASTAAKQEGSDVIVN